ncbi:ATP-dependent Clp protease adaptor ClpS [Agrococcus sp. Marseille-P2731]|uniref:ATP-dependent Clp protease adaptor ClpS n=1 Tax=Agrococcus sp. Marseille-P2731 TaxID=1841862 RepID=UPI000931BCBD|nr:ATP-dependent Clp protease adaptor ClpS [Agrococcus sp. Marseille-P2731]
MRAADGETATDAAAGTSTTPSESALGGEWSTMLWDDPVSLQPYVVRVLMRRFGYSRDRAHELMQLAERDGRTAVAQGSREEQEMHVAGLHADGLVATLERVSA